VPDRWAGRGGQATRIGAAREPRLGADEHEPPSLPPGYSAGRLILIKKTRYGKRKPLMIGIVRTDSGNQDFIELVKHLDADLAERDGKEHSFYAQFNKIDKIKYVVVAYENGKPAGCGAIKAYAPKTMEIKRMYTTPGSRGKGIASRVLSELETWAAELSCEKCILETGKKQPEAIGLYTKNGYKLIPNYGQYAGIETSVCFEKSLKD
jgi:putative acetyltransferase